jgi:hypothetical protein
MDITEFRGHKRIATVQWLTKDIEQPTEAFRCYGNME